MDFTGDVSLNFHNFLHNFEARYVSTECETSKVDELLKLMGKEASEIINTFDLSTEERHDYDKVVGEFEKYCNLEKNILEKHHTFFTRNQEDGEGIYHFFHDLEKLVRNCDFRTKNTSSLVRDRVFLGMRNIELRDKLAANEDVSLGVALMQCNLAEMSTESEENSQDENEGEIGTSG